MRARTQPLGEVFCRIGVRFRVEVVRTKSGSCPHRIPAPKSRLTVKRRGLGLQGPRTAPQTKIVTTRQLIRPLSRTTIKLLWDQGIGGRGSPDGRASASERPHRLIAPASRPRNDAPKPSLSAAATPRTLTKGHSCYPGISPTDGVAGRLDFTPMEGARGKTNLAHPTPSSLGAAQA